jgi:hypothetical protein
VTQARGPKLVSAQEADRIYRAIFRTPIPPELRIRYQRAIEVLERSADPAEVSHFQIALARVGDLEALEIACRLRRRLPQLSLRFQVMVHLAEVLPQNQGFFVNDRPRVLRGWLAILSGMFLTVGKVLKGLILMLRLQDA